MITLSAEVSAISSVSYFYVTETQRVARSCLLIDDECLLPTDMPEALFGKKREKLEKDEPLVRATVWHSKSSS